MLHDADIREPLFLFLEEYYGKIRIIEEKTMGKSRADVMMVTEDALVGIEIKSDADTYTRLARQVQDYDLFFDYNVVAVGTRHAMHIEEHVPAHWGIITVEEIDDPENGKEILDFYFLRKPRKNPNLRMDRKLQILWRPELALLQKQFATPKYKEKGRDFVIEKILERVEYPEEKKGRIDPEKLAAAISEILFERDYSQVKALLQDYRKGEMQKQIESETDPAKRLELMMEKEEMVRRFHDNGLGKKRRKRRRK